MHWIEFQQEATEITEKIALVFCVISCSEGHYSYFSSKGILATSEMDLPPPGRGQGPVGHGRVSAGSGLERW